MCERERESEQGEGYISQDVLRTQRLLTQPGGSQERLPDGGDACAETQNE